MLRPILPTLQLELAEPDQALWLTARRSKIGKQSFGQGSLLCEQVVKVQSNFDRLTLVRE